MKITTGEHYLAFVLDEKTRQALLSEFPSRFEVAKVDHVTVAYAFKEEDVATLQQLVDGPCTFETIDYIEVDGIDLMRVWVNRKTDRPLGGKYHLTMSRKAERASSDSNLVLTGMIKTGSIYLRRMKLSGEFKLVPYS